MNQEYSLVSAFEHSTQTRLCCSLGPQAAALSTKIVSKAAMSLTATMNLPEPRNILWQEHQLFNTNLCLLIVWWWMGNIVCQVCAASDDDQCSSRQDCNVYTCLLMVSDKENTNSPPSSQLLHSQHDHSNHESWLLWRAGYCSNFMILLLLKVFLDTKNTQNVCCESSPTTVII